MGKKGVQGSSSRGKHHSTGRGGHRGQSKSLLSRLDRDYDNGGRPDSAIDDAPGKQDGNEGSSEGEEEQIQIKVPVAMWVCREHSNVPFIGIY